MNYCPCLNSALSTLSYVPLRECPLAAPAFYRAYCACFLSLCALFWGASLGCDFWWQLWRAALGSSFGKQEQLWGAALRGSFEQKLWKTATLGTSFLERNFGGQLSVASLSSSSREPLWRIALGNRFEKQVWSIAALGQSFCRGILGNSFGKQLRGTALGSSFVEQIWGAILGSRRNFDIEEQLCTATSNCNFEEPQLWGLALERNFGERLSAATCGSSFWEPLWRIALGSRFGEQN